MDNLREGILTAGVLLAVMFGCIALINSGWRMANVTLDPHWTSLAKMRPQ